MKSCELCGKEAGLYLTAVEESTLLVCRECSGFGKVLRVVEKEPVRERLAETSRKEAIEIVRDDFPIVIKQSREKLGLSQKDFAMRINEKESLIQKLESGKLRPTIDLARKIEKAYGLKIVESVEQEAQKLKAPAHSGLTIGDLLQSKD